MIKKGNLIINQSVSHSSFNSLSQFSVSGKINSGIFNLYVEEKDKIDIPNIYNYSYTCNKTIINEINQTMNLSAINIKITNLQELKKITGWDGRQYTLVSRYALRYSLLKTGEQLGLWKLAPGEILERSRGEGEGKRGECIY